MNSAKSRHTARMQRDLEESGLYKSSRHHIDPSPLIKRQRPTSHNMTLPDSPDNMTSPELFTASLNSAFDRVLRRSLDRPKLNLDRPIIDTDHSAGNLTRPLRVHTSPDSSREKINKTTSNEKNRSQSEAGLLTTARPQFPAPVHPYSYPARGVLGADHPDVGLPVPPYPYPYPHISDLHPCHPFTTKLLQDYAAAATASVSNSPPTKSSIPDTLHSSLHHMRSAWLHQSHLGLHPTHPLLSHSGLGSVGDLPHGLLAGSYRDPHLVMNYPEYSREAPSQHRPTSNGRWTEKTTSRGRSSSSPPPESSPLITSSSSEHDETQTTEKSSGRSPTAADHDRVTSNTDDDEEEIDVVDSEDHGENPDSGRRSQEVTTDSEANHGRHRTPTPPGSPKLPRPSYPVPRITPYPAPSLLHSLPLPPALHPILSHPAALPHHPALLTLPGHSRPLRDPSRATTAKKYKCDLCNKAFSRSNTLVTHRRIHTGEKPFKCELCGRAFRQPGNLTRHRLTHTTVKPYVCPVCNKAFNRASNLHTHMRTHTSVKQYPWMTSLRRQGPTDVVQNEDLLGHSQA